MRKAFSHEQKKSIFEQKKESFKISQMKHFYPESLNNIKHLRSKSILPTNFEFILNLENKKKSTNQTQIVPLNENVIKVENKRDFVVKQFFLRKRTILANIFPNESILKEKKKEVRIGEFFSNFMEKSSIIVYEKSKDQILENEYLNKFTNNMTKINIDVPICMSNYKNQKKRNFCRENEKRKFLHRNLMDNFALIVQKQIIRCRFNRNLQKIRKFINSEIEALKNRIFFNFKKEKNYYCQSKTDISEIDDFQFNLVEFYIRNEPFPSQTQMHTQLYDISMQKMALTFEDDILSIYSLSACQIELSSHEEVHGLNIYSFCPLMMELKDYENNAQVENAFLSFFKKLVGSSKYKRKTQIRWFG